MTTHVCTFHVRLFALILMGLVPVQSKSLRIASELISHTVKSRQNIRLLNVCCRLLIIFYYKYLR
jgi:hypothetical protein